MFGRLKDWLWVARRYDRCPKVFLSAIALAALAIYWLRIPTLKICEALLGPMHESVGTACNNLAGYYRRQGRLEEAEQFAVRAVAISEAGGASDERRAIRYGVHGIMLFDLGQMLMGRAQAEKLTLATRRCQQALALGLCLHGRLSRPVAIDLHNLAHLRVFEGRWGAALRPHGRALAIRHTVLTSNDPELGYSLGNSAATLPQAGRAREGHRRAGVLAMLTEALAIFKGAFPDNPADPNCVSAAWWLAIALRTLLSLGPPFPDGPAPDAAEEERLSTAYALDPATIEVRDKTSAGRARAWEADGTDPL